MLHDFGLHDQSNGDVPYKTLEHVNYSINLIQINDFATHLIH